MFYHPTLQAASVTNSLKHSHGDHRNLSSEVYLHSVFKFLPYSSATLKNICSRSCQHCMVLRPRVFCYDRNILHSDMLTTHFLSAACGPCGLQIDEWPISQRDLNPTFSDFEINSPFWGTNGPLDPMQLLLVDIPTGCLDKCPSPSKHLRKSVWSLPGMGALPI